MENEKNEHHLWILHIRIILVSKFSLKLTILTFWTKFFQKRAFLIGKEKSEHLHWNLHIWISVGTRFQLKQIILTFWTKFAQKGHFWLKTKKVSTAIEFHNILILLNILSSFRLTTNERWVIITCKLGTYKLHHKLPNDLRLRILEN